MTNQLVIGAGEVGSALAIVLNCGKVDVGERWPNPVDVVHLCYPWDNRFIKSALEYVEQYMPQLVVVHSTVAPGTTRAISESGKGVGVVYSPVRGRHPLAADLRCYTKFVSSVDPVPQRAAVELLTEAGFNVKAMDTLVPETLELAKLFETTYSGLLIAYAQTMARYCEKKGASYWHAVEFFREIDYLPRVIFQPGWIGGHCIMLNVDILQGIDSNPLLWGIEKSNQQWALDHGESTTRLIPVPLDEL